jgi:hypothetical protein
MAGSSGVLKLAPGILPRGYWSIMGIPAGFCGDFVEADATLM